MKSRRRRSADCTSMSNVVVRPVPGGDETRIRPRSTAVRPISFSASGPGMPRSTSFLNAAAGGSSWMTSCSPVGCARTESRQLRALPSTCRRNGVALASRAAAGSPPSVFSAATTAWPTPRLDFGASTHDSLSLRLLGGWRIRGFSQTPSTSCRTPMPAGSQSMTSVAARAMTAASIVLRASSKPGSFVAASSRAAFSAASLPPMAPSCTCGSTSHSSISASISMPKGCTSAARIRRAWPTVSTCSAGGSDLLRIRE